VEVDDEFKYLFEADLGSESEGGDHDGLLEKLTNIANERD
jgi:hypothetical protein